MRFHARWVFVGAMMLVVAGCGGSGEEPAVVQDGPNACDARSSFGFCYEFTGTGWTDMEAQSACMSNPDAVFLAEGCPGSDRAATCTLVPQDDPGKEIVYVYYEGADVAEARSTCAGEFEDLR